MLSGRVGTYCVTRAFICLAALSAPMRSIAKYGLVWFFVKTAIFSPSAYTRPAAIQQTTITAKAAEDAESIGWLGVLCVLCGKRRDLIPIYSTPNANKTFPARPAGAPYPELVNSMPP